MIEIIKLILVLINASLSLFNYYNFWKTEKITYGINCIIGLLAVIIVQI